jgi:hypothetical protein
MDQYFRYNSFDCNILAGKFPSRPFVFNILQIYRGRGRKAGARGQRLGARG